MIYHLCQNFQQELLQHLVIKMQAELDLNGYFLHLNVKVPAELFDRIHEVHFSAALNGDGYIDKKNTHGVCHDNYSDFERDFELVSSLDTDGTLVVVAELSETDYSIRDNMKAEMNLLRYRVMQGVPLHD